MIDEDGEVDEEQLDLQIDQASDLQNLLQGFKLAEGIQE